MKVIKTISALFVTAIAVYFYSAGDIDREIEVTENPGYFEQFMAMKANSNGVIPRGLRTKWNSESKLMKAGNGLLENIEQVEGPIKTATGNAFGGRTRAVLIDSRDPNIIWAAAVSGGLWKSTNGGTNWTPVDDYSSSLAVTCIAQNPFNPMEIVYGTGEGRGNSAGIPGEGVFISQDGGESFERMTSTDGSTFNYIWDVEFSKTDSTVFYISTDAQDPNNSSNKYGLYKAMGGMDSVQRVFSSSRRIFRIQTLPDSTLFFARESSGIHRGHEGNSGQFTRLTNGLPTSSIGRCNISYCEAQDSVVYLSIYHSNNSEVLGVYRSDDRGDSWDEVANPDITLSTTAFQFGWYAHMLDVSPVNPDIVIAGYQNAVYTTNGGTSWSRLLNSHADYHIATFYPNTSNAIVGNDGGVWRYSYNPSLRTYSYTSLNNEYNVFQYYAGTYYPEGDDIVGGTQDNGTWGGVDDNGSFEKHNGGDGAYCEVDGLGERLYYSSQNGNLGRKNLTTNTKVSLYNQLAAATGSTDFWFINPFTVNRNDGTQLYFPTKNYVARTTNAGNNFQLITGRMIGNAYAIAVTREENPLLYVGGQSGILYWLDSAKTNTAGNEVRIGNLSPAQARGFIANIEIDPAGDSTIYLAMSNYSSFPSIWKVRNANTTTPTWESIAGNLPDELPVNWIEVDPLNSDHIIAATDFGLYTTVNGGNWWEKVEEIPNVSIHMIKLREFDRKLFIYTHGRGVWIADLSNNPVSTENAIDPIEVSIYPNPVHDYAKVRGMDNGHMWLYDLTGRVIEEGEFSNAQIDMRSVGQGTYILRMQNGGSEYTQKIIVGR